MSMMRSRWLWGIIGIAGAAWAYRSMKGNQQARKAMAGRSRQAWRGASRTGRAIRPNALRAASRAGRAVVDTTMRTVRAINRM
ncbi:MAG TPA: hypothetical protein GXZ82_00585 [Firmicutes bacterium]|jgi:hypothetical protein|nr:hypothetical protein [Bacillota bacterium]